MFLRIKEFNQLRIIHYWRKLCISGPVQFKSVFSDSQLSKYFFAGQTDLVPGFQISCQDEHDEQDSSESSASWFGSGELRPRVQQGKELCSII